MQLRDYQQACLDAILLSYRRGRRRVLVSLPTGTGKTVVFSRFPGFFGMKRRLLVLAHREELLEQAAAKFRAADPSASVAIEQAARRSAGERVVVASVPSLRGARLKALDPSDFYLVVVDEAHHAIADSYRAIFEHLGLFDPGTPRLLVGFTATPRRGDGQSLGEVFEEITFSRSLEEMIGLGHLAPIGGWRVYSEVDIGGVKVRHGDFIESQLGRAVNVAVRNELLVSSYVKLGAARKCLVFCADVAHAQAVAAVFSASGIAAEAVWGDMPKADRAAALERFRSGAGRVLTNCNLLTEGFDEPTVDCILMARPTKSLLLYAQMVGRGTRLAPGKQDLLVIDVVDNARQHSLAGLHQLFDLPEGFELRGASAFAAAEELRRIGRELPWVDLSRVTSASDLGLVAERVDLFRLDPPVEIRGATSLCWLPAAGGGYRLPVGPGEQVLLRPSLVTPWELLRVDRQGRESTALPVRARAPEQAITVADRIVGQRFAERLKLLRRDAAWRDKPATEKQLHLLQRRGLRFPSGLTRGQADRLIAYAPAPRTSPRAPRSR
ncbi:MAG: DEAD/DEAH box helicase [Deltaproteobacteria bacterium]|nr:DEAD/DEAH box helicase [Deltaproteobacteria bacterium]